MTSSQASQQGITDASVFQAGGKHCSCSGRNVLIRTRPPGTVATSEGLVEVEGSNSEEAATDHSDCIGPSKVEQRPVLNMTAAWVTVFAAVCLSLTVSAQPISSSLSSPSSGGGNLKAPSGFIKNYNGKFVADDCTEFIFTGFDSWRLLEGAQGLGNAIPPQSLLNNQNFVDYLFNLGTSKGMTVFRMFGFGDTQDNQGGALETSPGQYNESVFKSFDYVLDAAARHNVKLIIALSDNWKPTDGIQTYAKACNGGNFAGFWSSPSCLKMYQDHVGTVLNRVNSINGLAYKSDPAVFSWNIVNEPRCALSGDTDDSCKAGIQGFIDSMATFIKGIDKNHMVTVGEEGFFAQGDPAIAGNPSGGWAGKTGQDFRNNHMSKNIDFATIHLWPDNWKDFDGGFINNWLTSHSQVASQLGKPLILEEFGRELDSDSDSARSTERNPTFTQVYNFVQNSITTGGALRAAMFWEMYIRPQGAQIEGGITSRPYGVSQWDSTFT
ncbi:hypothetical protein WJX84_009430 [Apatococcus fuscideae]